MSAVVCLLTVSAFQMELFNAAAKEMGEDEAVFDESMFVGSGIMIEEQVLLLTASTIRSH